jgi:hypothetical protein
MKQKKIIMTREKLIHKKILNNWLLIIQAKNQLQERSH